MPPSVTIRRAIFSGEAHDPPDDGFRVGSAAGRNHQDGARMNHIAVDIVGLAQTIDTDAIALGNHTQGVAALDHVAAARAIIGKPGALRSGPAKMPIDSIGDGRGHFTPVLGIAQVAFILWIADETDLDQKTGYIR